MNCWSEGNQPVPKAMTGKEPGAFFCILFYGAIKEYGDERGRNPATLSLTEHFLLRICPTQLVPVAVNSQPAGLVPPDVFLFAALKKEAKKL